MKGNHGTDNVTSSPDVLSGMPVFAGTRVPVSIAVIVLRAPSNRVTDLRGLIPQLLAALPVAKRGEVIWVGI